MMGDQLHKFVAAEIGVCIIADTMFCMGDASNFMDDAVLDTVDLAHFVSLGPAGLHTRAADSCNNERQGSAVLRRRPAAES